MPVAILLTTTLEPVEEQGAVDTTIKPSVLRPMPVAMIPTTTLEPAE
jgi:hypothetical protein